MLFRIWLAASVMTIAGPAPAQTINPEPPLRANALITATPFDRDVIVMGPDQIFGVDHSSGRDQVFWIESRIDKASGAVRHRLWVRYIYRSPYPEEWIEAADDSAVSLSMGFGNAELLTCRGGCLRRETFYGDLTDLAPRRLRFLGRSGRQVMVEITPALVTVQRQAIEDAVPTP